MPHSKIYRGLVILGLGLNALYIRFTLTLQLNIDHGGVISGTKVRDGYLHFFHSLCKCQMSNVKCEKWGMQHQQKGEGKEQ